MGQSFEVGALGVSEAVLQGSAGHSAYMVADITEGRAVARSLEIFSDYSVPGASPVMVAGPVSSVDSSVGNIQIGSLTLDVNAVGGGVGGYAVGSAAVILGTQPVAGGLVLGQQRLLLDVSLPAEVRGDSSILSVAGNKAANRPTNYR